MIALRKSTCVIILVAVWTRYFLHETPFNLKAWLTGKRWLLDLDILQTFFESEVSLSLQGKQLMVFVSNNKIKAFKQKLEFWKTYSRHCEFDSFPTCRYFFLMILVAILLNIIFWDYKINCIILKNKITQWTSVFQMTNAWCCYGMHR